MYLQSTDENTGKRLCLSNLLDNSLFFCVKVKFIEKLVEIRATYGYTYIDASY